jgi:hypothetical protein
MLGIATSQIEVKIGEQPHSGSVFASRLRPSRSWSSVSLQRTRILALGPVKLGDPLGLLEINFAFQLASQQGRHRRQDANGLFTLLCYGV